MINTNSNQFQIGNQASVSLGAAVSPARNTFKSIVADLAKRPLRPLPVQQYAGAARSLASQVHGDTASAEYHLA